MESNFIAKNGLFVPKHSEEEYPCVFLYKELHDNQLQFWTSVMFEDEIMNYVVIYDLDENGKVIDNSRRYEVVIDDFKTNTTKFYDSVFNHEDPFADVEEVKGQA